MNYELGIMRAKVIILVCLLLAGTTVRAADTLPEGRWEVTLIKFEQNASGNRQTAEFNAADSVQSYIRFPQALEIRDSQRLVLCYPDRAEDMMAEYVLEGDQLKIRAVGVMLQYLYSINEGILTLTLVHNYVHNLSVRDTERIAETWTITLKRKE